MIPHHARVAAFDDNESHLKMIFNGLGKAGFWAMPFLFDVGKFEPELPSPFPGVRLIFSDIHMGNTPGGKSHSATFANTIIKGLKQVVSEGPYGLIFWSQYPEDAGAIWEEIKERAPEQGLPLPVLCETIDKKIVMDIGNPDATFDAEKLRELILDKIQSADVLALAMSWDERVSHAAIHSTNRLYKLAEPNGDLSKWTKLLAYLAQEAIGRDQAIASPIAAIDNAMLPILEDHLSALSQNEIGASNNDIGKSISEMLSQVSHLRMPDGISAASLNTHYLIEEVDPEKSHMWEHGMVSELGGGYRNSGRFVGHFGVGTEELIKSEFVRNESLNSPVADELVRKAKLLFVELSPLCDQVQAKIETHRYLLALLVPAELRSACDSLDKKKRFRNEYANSSIINIGEIKLEHQPATHYLLVSTRRFMTMPRGDSVDAKCVFRLRRTVIDELSHHYATYSRRPGVMRFS